MSQIGLFGAPAPDPVAAPAPPAWVPPRPVQAPVPVQVGQRRYVVCPATVTGSMDAVDVELAEWESVARAMAKLEPTGATLYQVEASGSWSKLAAMSRAGEITR